MKKLSFIILIFLTIFGGLFIGAYFFPQKVSLFQKTSTTATVASASIPAERKPSQPQTLTIQRLGVNAQIESVAMDEKGNMDVPKQVMNVAWYNLGAKPGERGNAVIAGHLDTVSGKPAVFYKLSSLEAGDTIMVTDAEKNSYTYTVVRKENYPFDSFPLQEVFGVSSKKRLNLITCEGSFDKTAKNYSHRTVVYAELSD